MKGFSDRSFIIIIKNCAVKNIGINYNVNRTQSRLQIRFNMNNEIVEIPIHQVNNTITATSSMQVVFVVNSLTSRRRFANEMC